MNEKFAILDEFKFEIQPVGVKYLVRPPEGISRLDQRMALCEMLRKAQEGEAFYADMKNHTCEAGPYVLGQTEVEPQLVSGEFGAGLGAFKDNRAAARVYNYIPRIARNAVNYIVFSPLDKLSFDPDVMIFLVPTSQAWILLRAMSYNTGKMWSSRYSSVIGCAWLLVYPFLSGEVNFITSGMGFGMRRRHLFQDGLQFIAIPFDQLPSIMSTLSDMPWIPEPFKPEGLDYVKQLRQRLGLE
ncbi:MAG: hypothetical protein A4E64_01417 [Syntrophorhabdus sp. PtaU1.Bin058]|nr:MAG: hypothetical protein A4E64_01417 [Syntrophorhabdus sp. PtaU1.Bin058]